MLCSGQDAVAVRGCERLESCERAFGWSLIGARRSELTVSRIDVVYEKAP